MNVVSFSVIKKDKNTIIHLFYRDLSNNKISSLSNRPFVGLASLHDLLITGNNIKKVPVDAFTGLTQLQVL